MYTEIFDRLQVKIESPFLNEVVKKVDLDKEIPFFLTQNFLDKLNYEYNVIPLNYTILTNALSEILKNDDLVYLLKVLYELICYRLLPSETITKFEPPKAPKNAENTLAYDCCLIFPILAHIPNSWQDYISRGVDKQFASDTLNNLDYCMQEESLIYGKPIFTTKYFLWWNAFNYGKSLRIGRLRFGVGEKSNLPIYAFKNTKTGEIKLLFDNVLRHKSGHIVGAFGFEDEKDSIFVKINETATSYIGYSVSKDNLISDNLITLNKNEWKILFKPNDNYLKLHIPYTGVFNKETINDSLNRVRDVYNKCYPEYNFKGIITTTWMLAPELEGILKESSNIYYFRTLFNKFPAKSSGVDIFEYVFNMNVKSQKDIDVDSLPENSSIQRGVKEKLKNGVYFHEFSGFIEY